MTGASTISGLSGETLPTSCADGARGVVVYVCRSCRTESDAEAEAAPRPGAILAETAIRLGALQDIEVRSVTCLANCKRGLTAALRSADGWSYVFGGLTPDRAQDLLDGAQLLSQSADGLMPWRGRPESLKRGMVARLPPIDFTEERS